MGLTVLPCSTFGLLVGFQDATVVLNQRTGKSKVGHGQITVHKTVLGWSVHQLRLQDQKLGVPKIFRLSLEELHWNKISFIIMIYIYKAQSR